MPQIAARLHGNSTNVRASLGLMGARWALAGAERLVPSLAARWAEEIFFTPPRSRVTARIEARLSTGRRFAVPFHDREIAAWSWGEGPTVLLVHGWGSRAAHLGAWVEPLVTAGFRAVAYDAPAHGETPGRQTNLPELATALQTVAAQVGPLRGAIGHSLGGAAVALAMRRGFDLGRAVLIAVPGDTEIYTSPLARHLRLSRRTVAAVRNRVEKRLGVRWTDFDVRLNATRLTAPALVVHDDADDQVPWEHGAAIARAWPGAVLHTTAGLGHRRILKDPDVIRRAVVFLKEAAMEAVRTATKAQACPSCGRPVGRDREVGHCDSCALDRTLFVPESRWPSLRELSDRV
jgi:pimeloyl-ACP methyl ester carboxylesterase